MSFFKKNEDGDYKDLVVSYKKAFSTQDGKIVLYDLMNNFHVLNDHGGDPFKEGQRSTVLEILKMVKVDVKALDEALKGADT